MTNGRSPSAGAGARRTQPFTGRDLRGLGPRVEAEIVEAAARADIGRRDAAFRRSLVAADAVAAGAALAVSISLVDGRAVTLPALVGVPLVVVYGKMAGLYDRDEHLINKAATLDEVPALFSLATLVALSASLVAAATGGALTVEAVVALWAGLLALLIVCRTVARALALRWTDRELCLVAGDADATAQLRSKLLANPHMNSEVIGYVPLREPVRADDPEPLGSLAALEAIVRSSNAHRVIVAPRDRDADASVDVVRRVKALGIKVSVVPRIFEVVGTSVAFDDVDGMTVLGVRRFGLTRSSAFVKRLLDLLGSVLGLLILSPFAMCLAVAIKLDSRGPVLFRQQRVGREGEVFEIAKFRTMVADAEAHKDALRAGNETEGLFKLTDDPRVTRVGRWLRRTSLDELPQLLNVLRGQMSLVGPRPLVLEEDRQVEGWHRRRLHLKPGMTGPWQILGSARIPLYEMVKIDYLYVANWSLWGDLKILLRTVSYVLARRGV